MQNWMLQEIEVGTKVWRGAREGNTSGFKVGEVISFGKSGGPRVRWTLSPGVVIQRKSGSAWEEFEVPWPIDTQGSPSVDSLVVVSESDYTRARVRAESVIEVLKSFNLDNKYNFVARALPDGVTMEDFKKRLFVMEVNLWEHRLR